MKRYLTVLKQAAYDWNDDNCLRLGASLAYYTLGSLFPLLFLVTAIASFFLTRTHVGNDVKETITNQLSISIHDPGLKQVLIDGLNGASSRAANKGLLGSTVGIVFLLFIASTVFTELNDAFSSIWHVPIADRGRGVLSFIKYRIASLALILGVASLLLLSTVLNSILTTVTKDLPLGPTWAIVGIGLHLCVTGAVFALLFKYLPATRVTWGDVWAGAVFTAVLWTLGQIVLTLYFSYVGSGTTAYGVIGSVLALLLYVYYSAQILFFGGEVTQAYANLYGSHRPLPNPRVEPVLTPEATLLVTTAYTTGNARHQAALTRVHTRHIMATLVIGTLSLIGGAVLGGVGLGMTIGRAFSILRRRTPIAHHHDRDG